MSSPKVLFGFHALGVRIIRQEAAHCGLKPQFSILDASDTVQIVSDVAGESDKGIAKQIFLGAREADLDIDYLKAFIAMAAQSRSG